MSSLSTILRRVSPFSRRGEGNLQAHAEPLYKQLVLSQCDLNQSLAQALPYDILLKIFTLLKHNPTHHFALLTCTYVCRSWNDASSPLLWRDIQLWLPKFEQRTYRPGLVERLTQEPPKTKVHRFLDVLTSSQQLSATIHCLHILGGQVDFVLLQSVVAQLANLRELFLQHVGFKALSVKTYKRPQTRLSLEKLILVGTFVTGHSSLNTPRILDVLVWFDAVEKLGIYMQRHVVNSWPYHSCICGVNTDIILSEAHFQGGEYLALYKAEARPQIPVGHLTLDGPILDILTYENHGAFDITSLETLKIIYINDVHLPAVNDFLHRHGSSIAHCYITAGIGDGFAGETEFKPHPQGMKHCIDMRTCHKLRSMVFSCTVQIPLPLEANPTCPMAWVWNYHLAGIVSAPFMEQLTLSLTLNAYAPEFSPEHPILAFMESVNWSILDQSATSLKRLRVDLDVDMRDREKGPEEEARMVAQCIGILRSKVSNRILCTLKVGL